MKRLSCVGVAMATMIFIFCASFSAGKAASSSPHFPKEVNKNRPSTLDFYWYYSDDSYDGFYTEDQVIAQMEDSLGTWVDTDPGGGIMVAEGYTNNNYPHTQWAAIVLYAHF